jgi:hypothetical protein
VITKPVLNALMPWHLGSQDPSALGAYSVITGKQTSEKSGSGGAFRNTIARGDEALAPEEKMWTYLLLNLYSEIVQGA